MRKYQPMRRFEMKDEIYKTYRIEARSVEYRSGGWPAEAVVEWREQGHAHTFRLHLPEGRGPFPTQDKAEAYAIGMAKQWIDGGKPGLNAEGG
jgi:hypothetical protein